MTDYLEWYGEVAVPAMKRSGFELLGAWGIANGLMGRDLVLIRFESMPHYTAATIALRKDPLLASGRERQSGRFTISETVKLCAPDPYSPPERIEQALHSPGPRRRRYLQTITQLAPGTTGATGATVEAAEAEGDVLRIVGYDTLVGSRGEQAAIWLLSDTGKASDGIGSLSARGPAGPGTAGIEEWQWHLEPLPYSPMQ